MSFLKQDINFNLLFLIGVVVTATVLLTLYFTHAMSNVNVDYNQLDDEYKETSTNLTQTTSSLKLCEETLQNFSIDLNESKKIEKKSRDEYNKIYEQTEGELTETQKVLKETKDLLDVTALNLDDMTKNYNLKSSALSAAEDELEKTQKKLKNAQDKLDDVENCADNGDIDCVKGVVD